MLPVKLPTERNAAAARIDAARSVFLAAFRAELTNISVMEAACEAAVTATVLQNLVDLHNG